jgi:hypothetical protein
MALKGKICCSKYEVLKPIYCCLARAAGIGGAFVVPTACLGTTAMVFTLTDESVPVLVYWPIKFEPYNSRRKRKALIT